MAGVFDRIFEALSDDADFEYVIVDGTIVRVHQHGTGAKGGTHNQAIGRSRGAIGEDGTPTRTAPQGP